MNRPKISDAEDPYKVAFVVLARWLDSTLTEMGAVQASRSPTVRGEARAWRPPLCTDTDTDQSGRVRGSIEALQQVETFIALLSIEASGGTLCELK